MRRGVVLVVLSAAVLSGIAWWGLAARARAMSVLARQTREQAVVTVTVIRPTRGAMQEEIVLPGTLQPFAEAPIYARTSGYLRRREVETGARVKAGQLLAEIDAPELEQQLQQTRADLATAEANLRLAQVTATRYLDLRRTDSVSQQDVDNASGALEARVAAVESARHNVQRLEQLKAFTRIYSPIAGVVTVRNTDVGALIDPGSAGGAARELFHIASTEKLRVFVNVPEAYAAATRPGLKADLTLAAFPGRRFTGTLARTASAIEVASRTLLVEIETFNPTRELLPGSYTEVHLKLPTASATWRVPVNTLMFRSEGVRVAVVREGGRIAITPVTAGRDLGTEMEIVAGLTGAEMVVANPPSSLVDGQVVRVAPTDSGAGRGAR
jgi:RND family efflux transporter MFP subunit